MKAIVYDAYGEPEMLRTEEVDEPQPRKGEVLLRVRAVEATKANCELRSFRFAVSWFRWPLRFLWGIRKPRNRILGSYFAGEVMGLGEGVERFSLGDRVFGCGQLRMRAYAEFAVYPENYTIAKMPEGLAFARAAASLLGGLNALHFLNLGGASEGERVLINGGGESIGLMAIQIAKARGADVVAVDKEAKRSVILKAGADRFIDFRRERFEGQDDRYDVIFNMVPEASFAACVRCLKPGGRYLMGNPKFLDMLKASLLPLDHGKKARFAFAGETQVDLEQLSQLIDAGEVSPVVDRVLSFERAAEAHRLVESEERTGVIVLEP
ncbi:MAG: NAD(P)-dependent alcohol dehydrogenase [Symploca sp. SIO2D2]|nr:NAD(P)-dependent alcohol dehydrogenase [Symploca sp. SIO2D2]